MKISFELDGKETTVDVPPDRPLRDVLRNECEARSVKSGCDSGRCGSCTVLMDGEAVKSCLVLAGKVDGRTVSTVAGIEEGSLGHDIQDAFEEHAAIQCGYCAPGFVLSAVSTLADDPEVDRADLREALAGNACRCTGYEKILDAVSDVAGEAGDTEAGND